jgi:cysteine-rich repeat protein
MRAGIVAAALLVLACGADEANAQAFGAPPAGADGRCGDGEVNDGEDCDDGNAAANDGCTAACAIEDEYDCTGAPSVCVGPFFRFHPKGGTDPDAVTAPVVEGVTMTEVIDCDPRTWSSGFTWACDTSGTWTMPTSDPVPRFHAPFTASGARAHLYTDDSYQAPTTTAGEVATEDFIATVVFYTTSSGAANGTSQYIFNKYNLASTLGWALRVNASDQVEAVVNATSVGASYTFSAFGEWVIASLVCKHDGSANSLYLIVNGAVSGSAGTCPAATSAAPTKNAELGGRSNADADQMAQGLISNSWLWTCSTCTAADGADLKDAAIEQHLRLMGVYPTNAQTGGFTPTAMTRASPAYAEIAVGEDQNVSNPIRAMFRLGQGWPRVERWAERGPDGRRRVGYHVEAAGTNLVLRSQEFDNASWTELTAGDSTTAAHAVAPWFATDHTSALTARKDADKLVLAASGAVEHGYSQAVTLTAHVYVISVWTGYATADSITTPYLWIQDSTVANAIAYFDTRDCQVEQVDAGVATSTAGYGIGMGGAISTDYGLDNLGYTWCRHSIKVLGTAAAHTIKFGVTDTIGTATYSAAGAENAAVLAGAQVERTYLGGQGAPPTSYIPTAGSTQQRVVDDLDFSYVNIPSSGGTLMSSMLMRELGQRGTVNGEVSSSTGCILVKDSSNYVMWEWTGEVQDVNQFGTAWDITTGGVRQVGNYACLGGTTFRDGQRKTMRGVFMANDGRAYVGDEQDSAICSDVSVTLPTFSSGQIDIGQIDFTNTHHAMGLVEDCTIYSGDVTPEFYP